MSFTIKHGDLLESVTEGYILHGCNAQGVMGSGFARHIRDKYPIVYEEYLRSYQSVGLFLGSVYPVIVNDKLAVLNGITQEHYGRDGQIYVSYHSLYDVFKGAITCIEYDLVPSRDLHMPLIGGGLGGGDKDSIIAIMEDVYSQVNINATLWLLDE